MTTRLQHRLEALYGLERRKDRLGLEGIRALLGALGDPHTRFRSVHVGGTNGKGTVCALIERVLREAGTRTGLFTSPHLVDFRERIRVSGRWVDEDWLDSALDRIAELPEGRGRTFFEVTTALGFLWFAEQQVEMAVVEVGLGGRLDCTNVLAPEVGVITTIGFDHTEILGDTLEKIAWEKAGIIKPGVPVVLSVRAGKALDVLKSVAEERGAPIADWDPVERVEIAEAPGQPARVGRIWQTGTVWGDLDAGSLEAPGPGSGSRGTALAALQALVRRGLPIPAEAVKAGFERMRWPGRMERCPTEPRLWWDGAHNSQAMRHLGSTWRHQHRDAPPLRVVLALSRDKDLSSVLTELRWAFKPLRLIATRSRSERAADPAAIAEEATRQGAEVETAPDVETAVRRALAVAAQGDVLLTGSLFAVGDAMEIFGGAPGEWL